MMRNGVSLSVVFVVFAVGVCAGDGVEANATLAEIAASGNPIFEGWYADPQIRRYGDTWWVFPTGSGESKDPCFNAFSSKDMKSWTLHPRILTTNEVTWAKGAMWAPDAHEVGGRYYLFFSANDAYPVGGKRGDGEPQTEAKLQGYGGIGVAVADRPEGPYRDLIGKPLIDRFWNRAQPIDQYVFEYKKEWYMVYGGWGRSNLVKLAKDFKSLVPFEDGAMWRNMTPKGYVEGSVMFERKGKWYFMYSGEIGQVTTTASTTAWAKVRSGRSSSRARCLESKGRLRPALDIIRSPAYPAQTSGSSAITAARFQTKGAATALYASTEWSSTPMAT